MTLPLMRPYGESYNAEIPFGVKVGNAMDPFVVRHVQELLSHSIPKPPTNGLQAMINHSCSPNASWSFKGRELSLIASRALSVGEEIHISYVEDTGDYFQRRRMLKSIWSFDCNCELCKQGPIGINADKEIGQRVLKSKCQWKP